MTTHSENAAPAAPAAILGSLANVMRSIGAIGKDRTNQQQGFKFRGIEQFMNAAHPLFAREGILVVPQVLGIEREERTNARGTTLIWTVAKITFEFISSVDGSTLKTTVVGEAMDSGDKGCNKAMSVGLKYALMQMLMIPTEETVDPDAEAHEVMPPPQAPQFQSLLEKIRQGLQEGLVTGDEIKHLTGKSSLHQLTPEDAVNMVAFLDGRREKQS